MIFSIKDSHSFFSCHTIQWKTNKKTGVIVCFQEGSITLKNPSGFKIDFSFLFALRNLLRSNEAKDQSWLETTYLSDDIRISR